MKKPKTKVSLIRHNSGIASTEYEVVKITGAVVINGAKNNYRAGNRMDEAEADSLTQIYDVTVTPFKN
jgi:hypothetical protein